MKKMNKKGFTIVELVIVIAVIAILAAVMIPTFSGIVEKANESAARQELVNAYKEAYALALADDGKFYTPASGAVAATNDETVEVSGFNFKFSYDTDKTVKCEIVDPDADGAKTAYPANFGYTATYDGTKDTWTLTPNPAA